MDAPKRPEPPRVADERATLTGFLQYQRETLALKCAGLTAGQLKQRAVRPSGPHWPRDEGGAFDVDIAGPAEAFEIWQAECARSRAIVDAAESLDITGHFGGDVSSLRYILTHLIEEYARHNGHADLLRERIDGATGE